MIKSLYLYLLGLSPFLKGTYIGGLFLGAPLMGMPITGLVYLSALFFSFWTGLAVAFLGYFASTILYYEMAQKISKIKFVEARLERIINRLPKMIKNPDTVTIALSAMIFPFLFMVLSLGLMKQDRLKAYTGIYLGGLPAFIIAYQAGAIGQNFVLEYNQTRLILSGILITVCLAVHFLFVRRAKRKFNV